MDDLGDIRSPESDPVEHVAAKTFRADLYYRLNVIPVQLPPLRKRRDDIPLLVQHFLRKYNEDLPTERQKGITRDSMEVLVGYEWPGNVRELENVMERAVILEETDQITVESLPEKLRQRDSGASTLITERAQVTLDELEKEYLIKVLNDTNWQKKKASQILGINASTLYRKIQRYGLDKELEKELVESE